ncbi:MAG: DUF1922 domain-containing protein [Promethearchaeota archaeon]
MEEKTFKKDTTPYIVFRCSKCKQFSYVKSTQKTKKCLRCGRTYQVRSLLTSSEIVYSMSAAVKAVQEKQNKLGLKKSDGAITLSTESDFIIIPSNSKKTIPSTSTDNYSEIFYKLLKELSRQNKTFPRYLIEIGAENYGIPASEVKLLIHEFLNKEILILFKNNGYYYTLKNL